MVLLAGVSPLSVSVAPSTVTQTSASSPVTSNPATATVTGGIPPYAYAWTVSNQSGPTNITVLSPALASTAFRSGTMPASTTETCDALVTVTDATGKTATAPASISLSRT
jgi:hypothetical protein